MGGDLHVICIMFVKCQNGLKSCPHPQWRSRKPSPSSIKDAVWTGTLPFRGCWRSSPEKDDLGYPICKMGHNPGYHHGAVISLE